MSGNLTVTLTMMLFPAHGDAKKGTLGKFTGATYQTKVRNLDTGGSSSLRRLRTPIFAPSQPRGLPSFGDVVIPSVPVPSWPCAEPTIAPRRRGGGEGGKGKLRGEEEEEDEDRGEEKEEN